MASGDARRCILSQTHLDRAGELAAFLASDDVSYLTGQRVYLTIGQIALNYTVPTKG